MYEPNGLYYMRARYYDPEVGRFISEDPVGFEGGNVNLYAYVNNNPINYTDPLGLKESGASIWADDLVLGGIVFGSESGSSMLRMFEEVGGEAFRFQWRSGGQLYHIADSAKWGFHFASEDTHWYWNRMVTQQSGQWVTVMYPLAGRAAGALGVGGLIAASGWAGWEIGTGISKLPVPNLVGASDWNVTFSNAFVPSSW